MIACHGCGQECLGGGKGGQAKRRQSSSNDRGADHIVRENFNSIVGICSRAITTVLRFVPHMVRFVPVDELHTKMDLREQHRSRLFLCVNPPLGRQLQF